MQSSKFYFKYFKNNESRLIGLRDCTSLAGPAAGFDSWEHCAMVVLSQRLSPISVDNGGRIGHALGPCNGM